jgi:CheY-like chemotaxis protein
MVNVRLHPGDPFEPCNGAGACSSSRLHLLLSCAGWHPDPWVDRLPRLLEPFGVISHKAGTGREASRVITSTPIHIAVVDMGLPLDTDTWEVEPEFQEGGPRVLELLARLDEPPPVVAVKRSRTHRSDNRDIAAALRLGAFAVIDRPRDVADMNLMLEVLRRCLERHYKGRWPGSS